jgi:hypothetical protein
MDNARSPKYMIVSTLNNQNMQALQISSLFMITLHYIFGPFCSISKIQISTMKLLSFTLPEQSFSFINMAPFGDDAMTVINDLHLILLHPFELMETPVLLHELELVL